MVFKFFDEVCHLPNCWLEIDAKCTHQFNNICPQLVQKIICRSESENAGIFILIVHSLVKNLLYL